jgi:hypothetical protein
MKRKRKMRRKMKMTKMQPAARRDLTLFSTLKCDLEMMLPSPIPTAPLVSPSLPSLYVRLFSAIAASPSFYRMGQGYRRGRGFPCLATGLWTSPRLREAINASAVESSWGPCPKHCGLGFGYPHELIFARVSP